MNAFQQAVRDLMYLDDHGALTGAAAILAERRAQLGEGRDPFRVTEPDPPSSIELTEGDVRALTGSLVKSGAMCAAHIDHLTREEAGND